MPQDALPFVKAFLVNEMDIEVRQNVPDSYKATDPAFLMIANDGGPMQFPVSTRPAVRITAYAAGRTEAVALVGKALGLLLCKRVPGLAHVGAGASIIDDRDATSRAFFASTTVTVTIRTATL